MGAEGVNKVAQKWEGIKRYEDEQAMGARLLRCVGGLVAMGARQQLGEVGICSMRGMFHMEQCCSGVGHG